MTLAPLLFQAASKKFRQFWGEKSELRRFRDGAIVEAVVWDEAPMVGGIGLKGMTRPKWANGQMGGAIGIGGMGVWGVMEVDTGVQEEAPTQGGAWFGG